MIRILLYFGVKKGTPWASGMVFMLGCFLIQGFPKIRGTFLGVPIIRTIVF